MADKPVTREEKYLAYLTGDYTGEIPKPITRKEKYLYELCLKGIGGEISPEEIRNAVNEYLEKNPVKPGATTEQAQQIEQNKTDIASLKEDISNKITKFYASNQGETHLTDSDNGKIQDMMIYGKSSQDGTPSPENPVEIKSVVNPTIKLLGSNILKIMDCEYQQDGLTVTVSNGVVKLKGTANTQQNISLTQNSKMFFKEGTEIIFSPNITKGIESQNNSYLDFSNDNTIGFSIQNNNINTPYIIKKRDSEYGFDLFFRCSAGVDYDKIWKPQLLIGKTITPFKPYTEQIITLPITLNAMPVSSGGNVTIDGQQYIADYVDVERGKLVKYLYAGKLSDLQCTVRLTEDPKWYDASISNSFELMNLKYKGIAFKNASLTAGFCNKAKTYGFSEFYGKTIECGVMNKDGYIIVNLPISLGINTTDLFMEWIKECYIIKEFNTPIESNLTAEEISAFKSLATYYPTTNISVNSEQLDGYTVFNYPISMVNGWNYVKQQLNDNRDYIYDMDLQSAESYVNSEYAVALTELEV